MDACDLHLVSDGSIEFSTSGYIRIRESQRSRPRARKNLARLILDAPRGLVVDHINHDILDNRRENLRLATSSQNSQNKLKTRDNTKYSQFKGVCFYAYDGKKLARPWRAYIKINGKRQWLGYFQTEADAALAYNEKAKELFGEFALLNDIDGTVESRPKHRNVIRVYIDAAIYRAVCMAS